ncbi:MAG: SDR family oxidoreductase [Hyphomicrobiales bacterium]|nr:SDR family oxidoreductase [Hyphomicrobiales bacterium]MCP4998357.1 SDR family oxidoreductase [Hyphomicrobiales bacterium]
MHQQKSILVTGCSSGIGAFCARALRDDGWRVLATARKQEDIDLLKSDNLEAFYLDYREAGSIAELTETVLKLTDGRLDALYNNGDYAQPGAVEDLSTDALREQFEANFFGWHDLTRRIVPVMHAQGHGRIVQCSSILGLVPMRWRGAYSASKFALEGLSVTLRQELAGTGIHVSLIEPGPIESKFTANALQYIEKNIDVEGSVHREAYEGELQRLRQGGIRSKHKLKPDAVYAVLKHALESNRPKTHYIVTWPAKTAVILKRILPSDTLYGLLGKR